MMTIPILARGKLTYYDEISDQLHDTNKDVISKADDICLATSEPNFCAYFWFLSPSLY